MSGSLTVSEEASAAGSIPRDRAGTSRQAASLLLLSAWCGLLAGLLEVGVTIVRRRLFDLNPLAPLPRDFLWQAPLADLAIIVTLGGVLSLAGRWRRRGPWMSYRLLCALTLLPAVWAASPRIFGAAGLLLALGASARLVPVLERRPAGFRRWVRISFPVLIAAVGLLAAVCLGREPLENWFDSRRPFPPPGRPNVLLVVLDTVAAGHLRLYGYRRPTSTTLDELSARGLRFDRARAASSWTLPSHASLFTGRWPHELSAGWLTPLDATHPTVAQYLRARGYATAGFVANYWYCATSSGLGRGFATYRDFIFPRLTAFQTAALVDRPLQGLRSLDRLLDDWLGLGVLDPLVQRLYWLFKFNRKPAAAVNREFLDWLSHRRQPERPFFAFVNYFDAHHPYRLAEPGLHRFGGDPDEEPLADPFEDDSPMADLPLSPEQVARSLDDYDNCVADLDEHLGRLIDELGRQGVLERTWVIVVGDHGESFGEHPGVLRHGSSLYREEIHVPLLILPPTVEEDPLRGTVAVPVSLRDLAATVVDVTGLRDGSPFPGESLARFRGGPTPTDRGGLAPALSEVVPIDPRRTDPSQWRERRWPLAALAEGDWTYIRRDGDLRQELFHTKVDADERHDLAEDPALGPTLDRLRRSLDHLTSGPLTPERFRP